MVFVFYVVANCAQIYDAFAGGRCHGKGSQMQDRSQDRCGGVSREGSRSGATCLVQSNHKPFGLTYTSKIKNQSRQTTTTACFNLRVT